MKRLTKSDIICLTETEFTAYTKVKFIAALQGVEVAYSNNQDRFWSIAECTTVATHILSHAKLTSTSFIIPLKSSFDNIV